MSVCISVCIVLFRLTSIRYVGALSSIHYSDKTRQHNAAMRTHTRTIRTHTHTVLNRLTPV